MVMEIKIITIFFRRLKKNVPRDANFEILILKKIYFILLSRIVTFAI